MTYQRETELNELYNSYPMDDLFDEILSMSGGDLWDGMMSTGMKEEYNLAIKIFKVRLALLTNKS